VILNSLSEEWKFNLESVSLNDFKVKRFNLGPKKMIDVVGNYNQLKYIHQNDFISP